MNTKGVFHSAGVHVSIYTHIHIYIHPMVPCDTLTPRALRVTAHAICQWVLVRFELAIFGIQAERSNHYTSVTAYILQCSFIPCVLVVLSITPRAIFLIAPLWGFFSLEKSLDFVSCFFSCTVTASSSLFLSMYVAKTLLKT